jgi:O-antigen/teichoic acid export membrane protein
LEPFQPVSFVKSSPVFVFNVLFTISVTSLKLKVLYQFTVSALLSLSPLLVFPFLSRVLGPENIGKVNFVDYSVQFLILLASFGIPFYGVREIARVRNNKAARKQLVSELVLLHILTSTLCLLAFLMLVFLSPESYGEKQLVILGALNLLATAFGTEWFIHGLEDFKFLASRSFLFKLASVLAIFLLLREPEHYIRYYAILVLTNLFTLATDLGYVLRHIGLRFAGLGLKKHLAPLSLFFLTSLSLSVYNYFDTVLLGMIAGSFAVGIYTTPLKLIRLSHNMINDVGGVLLPRLSSLIQENQQVEISRLLNKSVLYVLTVTLPLGFMLYLLAPEIILTLAGDQFSDAISVLQILASLPLIIGLSNVFFIQILLPFGKEKRILAGVIGGAVISITSNLILCPLYGAEGAAYACIIAELSVTVFLGISALKQVRLHLSRFQTGGIFLSCLPLIPVVLFFRHWIGSSLLVLLAAGMVGLLFYTFFQLRVFKNPVVKDILLFIKKLAGFAKSPSDERNS